MQLYNIWTVIPADGKGEQAVQWPIKLTEHFRANYSKYGTFEVMTSLDGPLGRPDWVWRCPSHSAWEEAHKVLAADAKMKALDKAARGLFVGSDNHFYQIRR